MHGSGSNLGGGCHYRKCGAVLHSNRVVKHSDRNVPKSCIRRKTLVWALIGAGLCVASLVGAFFFAPSRVFGLPDSEVDEPEVTIEEDTQPDFFNVGDSVGDSEVATSDSVSTSVSSDRAVLGSPYDGTISSTYVDIARDCMWNLGWFDNYVFWRIGQYDYGFAYGNIEYNNRTFTASNATILRITTPSNYSGALTVTTTEDSLSLSTGGRLVYSNLGGLPQLDSRKYLYDEVMYIGMVAIGLHVLSSASRFVLRYSSGS